MAFHRTDLTCPRYQNRLTWWWWRSRHIPWVFWRARYEVWLLGLGKQIARDLPTSLALAGIWITLAFSIPWNENFPAIDFSIMITVVILFIAPIIHLVILGDEERVEVVNRVVVSKRRLALLHLAFHTHQYMASVAQATAQAQALLSRITEPIDEAWRVKVLQAQQEKRVFEKLLEQLRKNSNYLDVLSKHTYEVLDMRTAYALLDFLRFRPARTSAEVQTIQDALKRLSEVRSAGRIDNIRDALVRLKEELTDFAITSDVHILVLGYEIIVVPGTSKVIERLCYELKSLEGDPRCVALAILVNKTRGFSLIELADLPRELIEAVRNGTLNTRSQVHGEPSLAQAAAEHFVTEKLPSPESSLACEATHRHSATSTTNTEATIEIQLEQLEKKFPPGLVDEMREVHGPLEDKRQEETSKVAEQFRDFVGLKFPVAGRESQPPPISDPERSLRVVTNGYSSAVLSCLCLVRKRVRVVYLLDAGPGFNFETRVMRAKLEAANIKTMLIDRNAFRNTTFRKQINLIMFGIEVIDPKGQILHPRKASNAFELILEELNRKQHENGDALPARPMVCAVGESWKVRQLNEVIDPSLLLLYDPEVLDHVITGTDFYDAEVDSQTSAKSFDLASSWFRWSVIVEWIRRENSTA